MVRDDIEVPNSGSNGKAMACIWLALILAVSLMPFGHFILPVQATNDPVQPAAGGTAYVDGEWDVDSIKEYHDCMIIVSGNITVLSGGSLILNNVTLKMNSTFNGQYKVIVMPNGAFKAYKGTLITAVNGLNHYTFSVNAIGVLDLDNVTLSHCGLSGVPEIERIGLYVTSDKVTINNSDMNNNGYGLVVESANITLTNSTLHHNDIHGAYFLGSISSKVSHVNVSDNGVYGLAVILCEMSSINFVKARNNGFDGIATYRSNLTLRNIYSDSNQRIGILSQSANVTVYDSKFTNQNGFFDVYATGHNQTAMTGPGNLFLYDVVFGNYHLHDRTQSLNVSFSTNISVNWYGGGAVDGAKVSILNNSFTSDGGVAYSGTADPAGKVTGLMLKALEDSMMGIWTHTPHTFKAEKSGLIGMVEQNISSPWTEAQVTIDPFPPVLNITTPQNGTLFNVSSIWVNGTAHDFNGIDRVEVSTNGVNWTKANGNETWSLTLTLPDGMHSIQARAFERLGTITEAMVNITIDTTAPAVYITSPFTGTLTNLTTVTVTGMTEPGANISSNGAYIDNSNGDFTFETTLPAEGANTIQVNVRDKSWNTNSTSIVVLRDTVGPVINVTWPPVGFGTKEDIVSVTGRVVGATNMSFQNNATFHEINVYNNIFDHYVPVHEGKNDIVVKAWDPAGNTAITVVTVIKDTTEPPLTVLWPNITMTKERFLTFQILTEPLANVTVNGYPVEDPDGDGNITYIMPLQNGGNTITVVSKDWLGNSNTTWKALEVDFLPPSIFIDKPTEGDVVKSRMVNIFGTAFDDMVVRLVEARIDDLQWFVCEGTDGWYKVLDLEPGEHTLTVRAWDLVGNNVTAVVNFSVLPGPIDVERPQIKITWPKDDINIVEGPVTFTGTAIDDVGIDIVEWSTDGTNWHPCNGTLYWNVTLNLQKGTYIFYFRATDGAGRNNISSVSFTVKEKGTGDLVDTGSWWMIWLIIALVIAIICVGAYAVYMGRRDSKAIEEEERIERRGSGLDDEEIEDDEDIEEDEDTEDE